MSCSVTEVNQTTKEETIDPNKDKVIWIEEKSFNEAEIIACKAAIKTKASSTNNQDTQSVISLSDDGEDVEFLKEVVHKTPRRQNAFSEHAYAENDVTLTPPPKRPMEADHISDTSWHVDIEFDQIKRSLQASADSELLVPLPSSDLEPELQAIAFKCEKKFKESKSKVKNSKVEIVVKPMSDPRCLYETDNKIFNMIRDIPLKFSMYSTDSFEKLINAYSIGKMTTSDKVILTYNEVRIFPHATPQSLGMGNQVEISAYSKEHFELTQTQKKRRLKKDLGEALEEQTPTFTIRLKHKNEGVEQLRVKKTTKLNRIVEAYKRQKSIMSPESVELSFDGVKLNLELTLEETEIEDGDLVFVTFKTST